MTLAVIVIYVILSFIISFKIKKIINVICIVAGFIYIAYGYISGAFFTDGHFLDLFKGFGIMMIALPSVLFSKEWWEKVSENLSNVNWDRNKGTKNFNSKKTSGGVTQTLLGMCPYCRKEVSRSATKCPYCKSEL